MCKTIKRADLPGTLAFEEASFMDQAKLNCLITLLSTRPPAILTFRRLPPDFCLDALLSLEHLDFTDLERLRHFFTPDCPVPRGPIRVEVEGGLTDEGATYLAQLFALDRVGRGVVCVCALNDNVDLTRAGIESLARTESDAREFLNCLHEL
jgi:hypothetical protein